MNGTRKHVQACINLKLNLNRTEENYLVEELKLSFITAEGQKMMADMDDCVKLIKEIEKMVEIVVIT